ncbi:MAG: T9SS type A sorting domain-containing protein [Bacteroidales bacterium]|nr:T9SS type A sorting domain-containing protein [Bacteroidales bacterium]
MHENCVGFAELGAPAPGNGKLMSYFTKDSVTVYGVAIAMDSMDCDSLQYAMFQGTLGKKVGGIMTLVDTATALNGISVNRFCYSIVGNGVLYEKFVPLYEYYFDHPHVLCDSFFVGYYKPLLDSEYVYYRNVIYYTQADSVNTSIMCRDPRSTEPMVCTSPHGWGRGVWGGWFPILVPCPPPALRLDSLGEWEKRFSWDGDAQDSFRLSVVEYQQPADSGTVFYLGDTSTTLFDGPRETFLAARVSVKCKAHEAKCPANHVWSPWSEPVYFYFGSIMPDTTHSTPDDSTTTGLHQIEDDRTVITLTPNPATKRVTVAAEGMESVELIGVDGTVLQRRECRNACTLDLRGLAAGVYMVRVGTPQGTATKRLVVQ